MTPDFDLGELEFKVEDFHKPLTDKGNNTVYVNHTTANAVIAQANAILRSKLKDALPVYGKHKMSPVWCTFLDRHNQDDSTHEGRLVCIRPLSQDGEGRGSK